MGMEEATTGDGRLIMAVVTRVYTARGAAQILGCDEGLVLELSFLLQNEDGVLWIHDDGDDKTLGFTDRGLDNIRQLIKDGYDRADP
jgi:hypothetical protein